MIQKNQTTIAIVLLLILGVATRFLPHLANFTAIGAIAMFGGLYLPRRWAVVGPMLTMLASDIFIGFYSWPIMLSVYAGFTIMGLIGLKIRENKSLAKVAIGTIAGSLSFFILTNASVWAFGTMYTHNLSGLIQCYTMALPFFKNSMMGDIFYTTALVGSLNAMIFLKNTGKSKSHLHIANTK
ncbi:MAG: DUF6580 family putative transport protein [Candidatus Magasanikbacteria bacterium]|jgi:hypothetical protein